METKTGTSAMKSLVIYFCTLFAFGFMFATRLPAQILTATNDFYAVYVLDEQNADGIGVYTFQTGANHPAGAFRDILYGGGVPYSSFNTIRSFTTGTDYTQTTYDPSSTNTVVSLDPFGSNTMLGTNGIRTTYVLPGPAAPTQTPDQLTIIQDIIIHGSNFLSSSIEVTTRIVNNGSQPVSIGVRYLWDYQIGDDDGPTFQALGPDGAVLTHEAAMVSPSFTDYMMADNDVNPNPPTLQIIASVNGPSSIVPTPTTPDLLEYACWGDSDSTAFDYVVDTNTDIATVNSTCGFGTGDCAVLYYFGADAGHALTIQPGQTNTVSASIFALSPAAQITGFSLAGANTVLNFQTISNAHYDVLTATGLVNAAWSAVASDILGTGGVFTNIHTNGATSPKRFYRVSSHY